MGGCGLPRYKGVLNAKHPKKIRVHFEHPHHLGLFLSIVSSLFPLKALCICCSRLPIPAGIYEPRCHRASSVQASSFKVTPTSSSSYTGCCHCFHLPLNSTWLRKPLISSHVRKSQRLTLHWSWLPQVDIWSPFQLICRSRNSLLWLSRSPGTCCAYQLHALLIGSSVVQMSSPSANRMPVLLTFLLTFLERGDCLPHSCGMCALLQGPFSPHMCPCRPLNSLCSELHLCASLFVLAQGWAHLSSWIFEVFLSIGGENREEN